MATTLSGIRRAPDSYADEVEHRSILARAIRYTMDRASETLPKDGTEPMTGPLGLAQYTEATPSDTRPNPAQYEGHLIYTTDTKSVWCSNGTVWFSL